MKRAFALLMALALVFSLGIGVSAAGTKGSITITNATIDLQSDWTAVFRDLPYADANGVPYVYEVVEVCEGAEWSPVYGEMQKISGSTPTYEITITNRHRWLDAVELPSTGGIGHPLLILIGLILVSAPFVYGFRMRRRYRKEARR